MLIPQAVVEQTGYSGARLSKSGDQSISGGATLTWEVEDWDTDGYHSAGANTRMTIPFSGRYRVGFDMRLTGGAAIFVSVYPDGGSDPIVQDHAGSNKNTYGAWVDVALNAGQYLEVICGSAAVSVSDGGGGLPPACFMIQRLS